MAFKKSYLSTALLLTLAQTSYAEQTYELADVNIDANASKTATGGGSSISSKSEFGGKTTINRRMIEATPAGNGDITSLLRTNPAVKFSNTNRQSTTMGEIDPADISINGAKYYQNNFMIDGMNINNDIDPAGNKATEVGTGGFSMIRSQSQGMAIDSDFIESIDVYDSDVSAKYGNFTGGVVEAKTRNPRDGFHGKFSMSHTRDSWTKYILHEGTEDEFEESATAANQPKFQKYTTKLNLEGFLTEDFGLMFGYTNTRSKIPLKAYTRSVDTKYFESTKNQRRNIDNYFLKGIWYATDRLTITPSITYTPQIHKVFVPSVKDSYWEFNSGGLMLGLNADYESSFAKIKNKFSYSRLKTSRDAEYEYRYAWAKSSQKPWGSTISTEGGFGDIDQEQKTYSYNLDVDFNKFELLGTSHNIATGIELKKQDAFYEIKRTFITASSASILNGKGCNSNDEWCFKDDSFKGKGQYFRTIGYYNAGKINVKQNSWAFYLEDNINFNRLTIRPGVRFSGDNYMNKKTISPRFSASYDVFGDNKTILNFGKNRYHGRNIFAYRLRDGQNSLITTKTRKTGYSTSWTTNQGRNTYKFQELNIPYDDETSFGITQKFANFELNAKYIKRKGRDQIIRSSAKKLGTQCGAGYTGNTCFIYSNDGKSDTNTWNVSLKNIDPFKIYGTKHTFELSYDKFKTKTNAKNYDTSDSQIDQEIYFDGKVTRYSELPAQDFTRPWTLRLTTTSQIPQANLTISNFITYKSKMDAIAQNGKYKHNNKQLIKYERVDLGASYSWDMRIGYEHKLPKDIRAFLNLDISNVLNRSNKTALSGTSSTVATYEAGRQFWLEAGLKW
ncbi:TonB-dependent receptor plug domain-containing protein [Campylobacter mucosalis]|uniref:TonB-dependent receptor n=1 Tax=Campylobacter mucosalis CCUG 21559 TaxID=1032067 RepID=A0A6G5QHQ0_9BACT|nr:TonB-dependent receptor plug domain-containing protein [Campylobacter mucosalis]QCD45129.1 TonB-dependent receptor [Campylobacter mucosalis CCUG 21559]